MLGNFYLCRGLNKQNRRKRDSENLIEQAEKTNSKQTKNENVKKQTDNSNLFTNTL